MPEDWKWAAKRKERRAELLASVRRSKSAPHSALGIVAMILGGALCMFGVLTMLITWLIPLAIVCIAFGGILCLAGSLAQS